MTSLLSVIGNPKGSLTHDILSLKFSHPRRSDAVFVDGKRVSKKKFNYIAASYLAILVLQTCSCNSFYGVGKRD